MLLLFKGTCEAVRAMHTYHTLADNATSSSRPQQLTPTHVDEDDEMFPHPEGDAEGGYSYGGGGRKAPSPSSVPLVTRQKPDEGESAFGGDEDRNPAENGNSSLDRSKTVLCPYAHRDLKPG